MILYTIVPPEEMFDEEEASALVEIARGEMRLIVTPTGQARARIVRLISSDPSDYLNPSYQPGEDIALAATDNIDNVSVKEGEHA